MDYHKWLLSQLRELSPKSIRVVPSRSKSSSRRNTFEFPRLTRKYLPGCRRSSRQTPMQVNSLTDYYNIVSKLRDSGPSSRVFVKGSTVTVSLPTTYSMVPPLVAWRVGIRTYRTLFGTKTFGANSSLASLATSSSRQTTSKQRAEPFAGWLRTNISVPSSLTLTLICSTCLAQVCTISIH